jgi:hypothetical protein
MTLPPSVEPASDENRSTLFRRLRAAGYHFFISAVIGGGLFSLFWFQLYRAPLFQAVGGLEIFLMLLAIDVVLGPVMTMIVWKKDWKQLCKDLAVIAFVQLAAVCYGVYTLWIARPVYIAALGPRFDIVHATDVDDKELATSWKSLPLLGPEWVGVKQPIDPKERERILFSALGGADYGHFPQHHQPIENMRDEILRNAQPISDLKKLNPGEETAIDRWLEKRGVKADDVIYQGLKARAKDMAVIMDAKTAKVIGIAPFKPWP